MNKFYTIVIRIFTTILIYLFLYSIVFFYGDFNINVLTPICVFVAFLLSIPSTKYIVFKLFSSQEKNEFVSNTEKKSLQTFAKTINSKNKFLKKGWLRLHVVLSLLLTIVITAIINPSDPPVFGFLGLILLVFGGYWIFVFVIIWVIKGFKETD